VHLKKNHALEEGLNAVGERAMTRHLLWMLIVAHIVAMVRLKRGVERNLLSTMHIPRPGKMECLVRRSEVARM